MGEFLDLIDDVHYGLRKMFKKKKSTSNQHRPQGANVKRWAIELGVAVVVGILTGCITYGLLNKEDKSLKVSEENAVAIEDSKTPASVDSNDATSEEPEEDFSDVVITVVDPSGYAPAIADWSADQINAAVNERRSYLDNNKYWPAVSDYWESKGVTDVACYCQYLFDTDKTVYSASDFSGLSPEVIHIAKNEIYARHGYSFKDKDIYNYFMGQIWYSPSILPKDFTEDIFTETEVKNLDMLNSIDNM